MFPRLGHASVRPVLSRVHGGRHPSAIRNARGDHHGRRGVGCVRGAGRTRGTCQLRHDRAISRVGIRRCHGLDHCHVGRRLRPGDRRGYPAGRPPRRDLLARQRNPTVGRRPVTTAALGSTGQFGQCRAGLRVAIPIERFGHRRVHSPAPGNRHGQHDDSAFRRRSAWPAAIPLAHHGHCCRGQLIADQTTLTTSRQWRCLRPRANGAVVVWIVAVPGATGTQVAAIEPSGSGCDVQRTTDSSELINGPHG